CPHCDAELKPLALADGWCEECGKRIPDFALRAAGLATPWAEELVVVGTFEQRQLAERALCWLPSAAHAVLELSAHRARAVWVSRVPAGDAAHGRDFLARAAEEPIHSQRDDTGCYLCGGQLRGDERALRVCRACREPDPAAGRCAF